MRTVKIFLIKQFIIPLLKPVYLIKKISRRIKQLPSWLLVIIFSLILIPRGWCEYNDCSDLFIDKADEITLKSIPRLQENPNLYRHRYQDEKGNSFAVEVTSVAFSPDSQILASGDDKGEINLWKNERGKIQAQKLQSLVTDKNNPVWTIAFIPDDKKYKLVSGSSDGKIRLWDISKEKETTTGEDKKKETKKLTPYDERDNKSTVFSVAVSRDGKYLASGTLNDVNGEDETTLNLWNLKEIKQPATTYKATHKKQINTVDFNQSGTILASGSADGTIELWEFKNNNLKQIKTLTHSSDSPVMAIKFSLIKRRKTLAVGANKIKEYLASASFDGVIKLWDINAIVNSQNSTNPKNKSNPDKNEPRPIAIMEGHNRLWYLAFSPKNKNDDGNQQILATGSEDGTIKLWNSSNGKEVRTLKSHPYTVYSLAFSPDGYKLASSSMDETIKLWEVKHTIDMGWLPPRRLRFW